MYDVTCDVELLVPYPCDMTLGSSDFESYMIDEL